MKMKNLNQKGITLIELLAVLTIFSIIAGVLYSVFMNGLNYSTKAKDTVLIQQEANYLLNLLKKQHEKDRDYTVKIENNETFMILEGETVVISENDSDFLYFICDLDNQGENSCEKPYAANFSKQINPLKEPFRMKLMLKSKKDHNLQFEVETILSRL
ncbi:PilW family protein [Bacillus benzoevorans]|uniref:Prepilin-type N-terminal cleavage/methylation domain-containing protein n=1 Tax=Bacillus benzoevorans TaxID=1456 RepID=A0A7X0HS60_9BACI|nr:type II secretion system protein [Bacillus benzoevorans]MBB6445854.1 prepilin-type N-terminal cleavage/methylation domain-containing protein [Bacillus benzoevorans]